jgi:hypothetical protein
MQLVLAKIFAVILFISCSSTKQQTKDEVPSCINTMIQAFKSEQKQNPPRSITQFNYKGRQVYYVTSPCCDQFNSVVDSTCNVLGAPDGGITGKGDGKIPDFHQTATRVRVVWQDERQ